MQRVGDFIRECGLAKFVYKSDQETVAKALIENAVKRSGREGSLVPKDDGDPAVTAVPESNPVGSSASNARAEKTIQSVEDLLRTLKAALEAHNGGEQALPRALHRQRHVQPVRGGRAWEGFLFPFGTTQRNF